jgi:hypothetical protein
MSATDGTVRGWVRRPADYGVMIAVMRRWYYVHGPEPVGPDVEYPPNPKGRV